MALTRLALTALAALLVAAPASASTVRLDPGGGDESTTVTYTAQPGEANKVSVSADGRRATIEDPGAGSIAAGQGCTLLTPKRAVCDTQDSTAPVERIAADLGDGGDSFELTSAGTTFVGSHVKGGEGDDDLRGGSFFDLLDGGSGRDELLGGDGQDSFTTADATGAADADAIDGGPGFDSFSGYRARTMPVRVDFSAGGASGEAGEGDTLSNLESVEGGGAGDDLIGTDQTNWLVGNAGDDTIAGGDGPDYVNGGDGNDTLSPGPGVDDIEGGSGDDTINLGNRPGDYDRFVFCGDGADRVNELFEAFPAIGIDCERADLGSGIVITTLPRRATRTYVAMTIPCPAAFRDANGLCAGKLVVEPRLAFKRSATTRYRTRYGAREFRFTSETARVTVHLNARGRKELAKPFWRLQFTLRLKETATAKVREFAWTEVLNRRFLKDRGVG